MRLIDVPNGSIFRLHDDPVLKTEYFSRVDDVYIPDCYIIGTGEKFCGGMKTKDDFKTKFNDLEVEVINVLPDVSDTSSDTISRQSAIDEITEYGSGDTIYMSVVELKRRIEQLPTAQSERQKGEWIDHTEDGYVECPFCHSATNCDENKYELHFCFSCGADMRGE